MKLRSALLQGIDVRQGRRRLAARGFYASTRLKEVGARGGTALFGGLWLGMLSAETLHEVDRLYYDRVQENWNGEYMRYADARYTMRGLVGWEASAVRRHFPRDGQVVVTSAGAGREVLWLLRAGYDAVGYEPNRSLVAAGGRTLERLGYPGRLHQAPWDTFPVDAPRCDAVLIGWASYMHIAGSAQRVRWLSEARHSLRPGGIVLSSFALRDRTTRTMRATTVIANGCRGLRGAPAVEVGDRLAPNFEHLFTRQEIETELRQAGLEPLEINTTPYPHAVARRPGSHA